MSMITATQWVPRGFAAPVPIKYELDDAEFERIAELAKLHLEDAKEDLMEAQETDTLEAEEEDASNDDGGKGKHKARNSTKAPNSSKHRNKISQFKADQEAEDDDLKEYDLEHYDDGDDDDNTAEAQTMSMFANAKSLAYYESNDQDPYITLKGSGDDDEEKDELRILATDNLLLASKVEDEVAHLEIYVYEDEADNLYVHHDIMLPSIPLCVEWLDYPVQKQKVVDDAVANYVAVGTMDPDIEIWDLDVVDCMYPNAILGEAKNSSSRGVDKERRKSKSKKACATYHIDAVLALAANRKHRNLLASGSADTTIKLWDLTTTSCVSSYVNHKDKVCSLAWNAAEPTILLSGSYDRTVAAADMRAPSAAYARWDFESDVETVKWDPHDSNLFYVATEAGLLYLHDARVASADPAKAKAIWTLQAHDEAVTAFDANPAVPGFLATGSADRTVKLWNVAPGGAGPTMVVSRNPDVGKVFSAGFAPDSEVAFRLAVAGSKGEMRVWDTSTNAAVRATFAHRVSDRGVEVSGNDRLVGLEDDDDDDTEGESESGEEDEDEDGGGGAKVEAMDEN